MQQKFQQSVELKLEAFSKRLENVDSAQSAVDKKVEALIKRIESVERGDTSAHMLEEKLQSLLKLHSHL